MPYGNFKQLTDEDTLAIIAYLRSRPAIRREVPQTEIDFPVSMFIRAAPAPLEGSPPAWPEDELERGNLLVRMMGCYDCHTPMDKGEYVEGMDFAGGNPFPGEYGTVYTSNITPDEATGIGAYTDEDLMRVFREGRGKDGRLLWVMPWSMYSGTEERDLRAVIAALRRVRPVSHAVPPPEVREEYVRRAEAAQAAATPPPPAPPADLIPPAPPGDVTPPAPPGDVTPPAPPGDVSPPAPPAPDPAPAPPP
jgi:hypothetical protein